MSEVVIEIEIPENCIEAGSVAIVQYMDADGELHYVVDIDGDLPLSSFVGLMEMGKMRLMLEANDLEEDE